MTIQDIRSHVLLCLVAILVTVPLSATAAENQTTLVVYSTVEPDEAKPWREAFEKDNPNIKLELIRSSSGTAEARILAEKDNPRFDVIWRIANTSLIEFAREGLLEPYEPKGLDRIDPRFRDKNKSGKTYWVGHSGYTAAFCFNTVEAAKRHIPLPKTYADLTAPVWIDNLAAPNPNASGTGFINAMAWIKLWGEDKAFDYMDALHKNMKFYLDSGSAPCQKAATGEVAGALSWDMRAVDLKTEGAPIDVIFFKEGVGWDLQGSAIRKGTPKMEAAKQFMDWVISDSAMRLYSQKYHVLGLPGFEKPSSIYPQNFSHLLVDYDFEYNADNRQRILKKWTERYGTKIEQK